MSLYDVIRYLCIIYYHWREYYILPATSQEVNAQHHGAPPPAATIGERKLVLDMQTIPVNIAQGDDVMMTIGFRDEGKNANIQHVTFRMDISKDGKHILSDFFHDHSGEVKLRAITLPRGYQCFIELRSSIIRNISNALSSQNSVIGIKETNSMASNRNENGVVSVTD